MVVPFAFLLLILSWVVAVQSSDFRVTAPSVFRSDETEFHKYAAILAATAPFKDVCNKQVQKSVNPIRRLLFGMSGKDSMELALPLRKKNRKIDEAISRYEDRVEDALRAYGMTAQSFNEISSSVKSKSSLQRKIMLQAYNYKIAADFETNLGPQLPQLPSLHRTPLLKLPSVAGKVEAWQEESTEEDSSLTRFARTVAHIESERVALRNHLMDVLHVSELPPNMGDPKFAASYSPPIRKACAEFPKRAAGIIKLNGLYPEEFNEYQSRLERDFFFRWRVHREVNRITKSNR